MDIMVCDKLVRCFGVQAREVTKLGFIGLDQTDILLLYREWTVNGEHEFAEIVWTIPSPIWLCNLHNWLWERIYS